MPDIKCTVVIPEHNRPLHLKRLLDFYLKYEINIIVSDSSDIEFIYNDEYQGKIIYRHYPKMPLAEKINAISSLITTPYVFMCANDDFIVPETVNNIILFLENNIDYNSGQGIYVKFDPLKKEIKPLLIYENMLKEKLDELICTDRLLHLLSNYFQFYYAVFRTEIFNKIYASVIIEDISVIKNLRLLEIYVSCYSVILGKHIVLPEFYGARESIFMSAGAMTDTMYDVVNNSKYKLEFSEFVKLLSEAISKKEDLTKEESSEILIKAINIYLNKNYPKKNKVIYLFTQLINKRFISGLKNIIYSQKIKHVSNTIPSRIEGMNYWKKINQHILNYQNIYK